MVAVVDPRWLWSARTLPARLARTVLIPPSLVYRAAMGARKRAYDLRLLPRREPALPVVSVGNLTVGGSGKTPVASWIADYYLRTGYQPAIVLRGYGGGDEGRVHRRLVQNAIVVENPDRAAGVEQAAVQGAQVVVLDDAFQRLDLRRDLDLVLVSAESSRAVRWTLPAGPWREGFRALGRADILVVTRKRADRTAAERLARQLRRWAPNRPVAVARLAFTRFTGLLSGAVVDREHLTGAQVLAAAGIADPHSFAGQCRALGARVRSMGFDDHHAYSDRDVRRMLQAGRGLDYVIVTEKDAVKLRDLWPSTAPEPLVASIGVHWERGESEIRAGLDAVVPDIDEFDPFGKPAYQDRPAPR